MIPSMTYTGIFNTPEFYVIVSVIAAAVIAIMSLPERKGEAVTHLLAGNLIASCPGSDSDTGPGHGSISFECLDGNIVILRRNGIQGLTASGAVSLAVNVSGFDIRIDERITPGPDASSCHVSSAIFTLDFLAPEWYHIRYESERHSEHAALTLHVREGITISKPLIH